MPGKLGCSAIQAACDRSSTARQPESSERLPAFNSGQRNRATAEVAQAQRRQAGEHVKRAGDSTRWLMTKIYRPRTSPTLNHQAKAFGKMSDQSKQQSPSARRANRRPSAERGTRRLAERRRAWRSADASRFRDRRHRHARSADAGPSATARHFPHRRHGNAATAAALATKTAWRTPTPPRAMCCRPRISVFAASYLA